MNLYPFQIKAIHDLNTNPNKHFAILGTGCGKTAIMLRHLEHTVNQTNLRKILIITTPAKRDSGDFIRDAEVFAPSLTSQAPNLLQPQLQIISWHNLAKWYTQHHDEVPEYIFAFDEVAKAKAGVSTQMGRTFLKITRRTPNWSGYTATPADDWLGFYPYFQATQKVKTKTEYLKTFATVQTYKGYPEITEWHHTETLNRWWSEIATTPDTSQIYRELPAETHRTIQFSLPPTYKTTLKTRTTPDGEELDTAPKLCHYLRYLSFTKKKQEWLQDFLERHHTNAVIFYNYIKEGDLIEAIAKKALPDTAKIWRIDGRNHDIPAEETISPRDTILCQWQSGSEALNLQFVNYWISTTPHYSYSTSIQARGRIKRIGQRKPMFYYYLKCQGIEEDIYRCLKNKSDFSEDNWLPNIKEALTNHN